jgi:hypothetical protein
MVSSRTGVFEPKDSQSYVARQKKVFAEEGAPTETKTQEEDRRSEKVV